MAGRFQVGDRVRLVSEYWVYTPDDCKSDQSVLALAVGEACGTVESLGFNFSETDMYIVLWDANKNGSAWGVNGACLDFEVTDDDVEAAMDSIIETMRSRHDQ